MLPKFSIILPTKDRPDYADFAMQSIKMQTYQDFEVIFCDNYVSNSAKYVFDKYADQRFKYYKPDTFLGMADNWEYAVTLAKGEFILFLIDKTVLLPNALDTLNEAIKRYPNADIINFYHEIFTLNSTNILGSGKIKPIYGKNQMKLFNPRQILQECIKFSRKRGLEGVKYFYGKLCYGIYSSSLIGKIKEKNNILFYPISPDYTSRTAALLLSEVCVDIGEPLIVSFSGTGISNGANCAKYPKIAKSFISTCKDWQNIIANLPLNNLYVSQHNCVAYDYQFIIDLTKENDKFLLNKENLTVRAFHDFLNLDWEGNKKEKREQWGFLYTAIKSLPPLKYMELLYIYCWHYIYLYLKSLTFIRLLLRKIPLKKTYYYECNNIFESFDIINSKKENA